MINKYGEKITMKITQLAMTAVIFLVLGTVYDFADSVPLTKRAFNFDGTVRDASETLNLLLLKYINDDLKPEQNVIFSPMNIYTSLMLLHLGTSGQTKDELSIRLVGEPVNDEQTAFLHEKYALFLYLVTRFLTEIKIKNSLFLQNGLQLNQTYSKGIESYYNCKPQQVDFSKAGSEATDFVNNWISSQTENRITKFFKSEISSDTKFLLASTSLFSSPWLKPFSRLNTVNGKFDTGVKEIDVPMMNRKGPTLYMDIPELSFEAIVLPYKYKYTQFGMFIVLPYRNSSVSDFINHFPVERYLQRTIGKRFSDNTTYVDYKIPRFQFTYSQSINSYVKKFGIKKIFAENPEFRSMLKNATNVHVSDINHASEIQIDENGSSSSSDASTSGLNPVKLQDAQDPVKFYVDRPFVFMILDLRTSYTFFSGIVQNPLAAQNFLNSEI